MPIYEYECSKGHLTERLELISKQTPQIQCPTCGEPADKKISRSSWQFYKKDDGIKMLPPTIKNW